MKAMLMRQGLYVVALTVVWTMLWDRISVANIAGGVVVSCVLLAVFPTAWRAHEKRRHAPVVRPLAVARLCGYVAWQLVVSNWMVARQIVRRRADVRTGIVGCRLHTSSVPLTTLIANILSLSPGTMTVDVRSQPSTIYVHVLVLRNVLEVRRSVAHLERLVLLAFASDGDVIDPITGVVQP